MRKYVIAAVAAFAVAAVAPAAASAEGDPVMCTLEKKGLVHSPIGSFCSDEPWESR